MAGDWLKIECSTPDKPEVFEIALSLKISVPETLGRLFLVWRLFDQQTSDGNAPSVSEAYVDHVAGVSGFAEAMRKVHWLAGGEDGTAGISLPHFDIHNGKTAKSRVLTARRVATHKTRNANATVTQPPLPREEKRREEVREKGGAAPTSRGSRLTIEFLPEDWKTFCNAERPEIDAGATFQAFRDYWIAVAGQKGVKANWDSTWRNWVRRENAAKPTRGAAREEIAWT